MSMVSIRSAVALVVLLGGWPQNAFSKCSQTARSPRSSSLSIPKAGKFDHSETITVAYDKFKNYTVAQIDPPMRLRVVKVDHDLRSLDFSAFYFCFGQRLRPPKNVTLHFVAQSAEPWYRNHVHTLVLLIDGRRLDLGVVEWDQGDVVAGMAEESMSVDVSLRDFLSLVNASRVEAQLGGTELSLSHENLEALRDLASRMNSTGVTESAAPIATESQAPGVTTKYDAFKDETTLTLRLSVSPDAEMIVMQHCAGNVQRCVLTGPDYLRNPALFIIGRTDDVPDVTSIYPMLLLIDGERLDLGNMGCQFDRFIASRVQWRCYMSPYVDNFLKLIHGHSVRVQIARWEFQLTGQQLLALEDFGRRLGYEPSQTPGAAVPRPGQQIAAPTQPQATSAATDSNPSAISSVLNRRQGARLIEDNFRQNGYNVRVTTTGADDTSIVFASKVFADKRYRDAVFQQFTTSGLNGLCTLGFRRLVVNGPHNTEARDLDCSSSH